MIQITPVVRNLLFLNFGIFLLGILLKIDFSEIFGLHYIFSNEFAPYQILTHLFLHGDFGHIFGNMLSLFFFGPLLENYMGSKRFLIFYFICGFGASLLYTSVNYWDISQLKDIITAYVAHPNPSDFTVLMSKYGYMFKPEAIFELTNEFEESPNSFALIEQTKEVAEAIYYAKTSIELIGASGAVFGILMAFALIFPNVEMMLLFPPIPIKAKYFVALYGMYELYAEIIQKAGDNVAHTAHLGGMLFAFILIKYWGLKRVR
ncbi:MAG: rhomboid family intramembrane serine protease [Thermoflexibacter sp.]|jgi:membrane associated rhomboid family serine protease|nr:rhomboid family intramembrane serine protease [Thermoflexibacter sp.]